MHEKIKEELEKIYAKEISDGIMGICNCNDFEKVKKQHKYKIRKFGDYVDYILYVITSHPNVEKGERLHIIEMKGEPNYAGKEGIVEFVDDADQIHGTWGGCALIPKEDKYEKCRVL